MSDITLVGGSFFLPKKQLVHGTNWWVYCPFPKKTVSTWPGTNWWVYCPFPKKQLVNGTQLELIILQMFIIIMIIMIVVQFTAIHADRRYNYNTIN